MTSLFKTSYYEAVYATNKTMFIILSTDRRASDADPDRAPTQRFPTRDEQGLVNYYEEADASMERKWREKLGIYLYNYVLKPEMERRGINPPPKPDKVYLANFPANYSLWVHKKGDPHDPRTDHYLYGSRWVAQFRSPMEFCLHLKWLLEGQPMKKSRRPDCQCRYCDGTIPQGEISSALGNYHPSRRDKDKKDKDKDRDGKHGRPKTSHNAIISTSIPYKDYTKLHSASA
ncbi:hypothetical protein BN946_scf184775.g28 [Trametes cinnabarina]|uniref:Cryptic loci regulator 2 N-terminal domain-containing protein n=1 Tax=Pycnoporus cinnabarinus TaxID=5643 RepID=A0A060SS51_PYCCI|nr:hypothetical protein BN946_scf184775.g28 [Trametes cinnabarina]